MTTTITDDAIEYIKAQTEALIRRAESLGVVVTVSLEPLQPLAMGHYKMVADVQHEHLY